MGEVMRWITGIPPAEVVAAHESIHLRGDEWDQWDGIHRTISISRLNPDGKTHTSTEAPGDNRSYGDWIIFHTKSPFGQYPSMSRLRTVDGVVLLANGFSFWQPLADCPWAADVRYLPVTVEGVPLDWQENGGQAD